MQSSPHVLSSVFSSTKTRLILCSIVALTTVVAVLGGVFLFSQRMGAPTPYITATSHVDSVHVLPNQGRCTIDNSSSQGEVQCFGTTHTSQLRVHPGDTILISLPEEVYKSPRSLFIQYSDYRIAAYDKFVYTAENVSPTLVLHSPLENPIIHLEWKTYDLRYLPENRSALLILKELWSLDTL